MADGGFPAPWVAAKWARGAHLRTSVRRAIIGIIAHSFTRRNHPDIPPPESSMTTAGSLQIVPESPPSAPALRAADRGVAEALESVLSDNTKRVYQTQWKLFDEWCGDVDLRSLPAEALTVARYLAVRAGDGASIATMRLATSAIAKAHEWAGHESPSKDRGVRASLKG